MVNRIIGGHFVFGFIFLLFMGTGCDSKKELAKLQEEVERRKERNAQLEKKNERHRNRIQRLSSDTIKMSKKRDELNQALGAYRATKDSLIFEEYNRLMAKYKSAKRELKRKRKRYDLLFSSIKKLKEDLKLIEEIAKDAR